MVQPMDVHDDQIAPPAPDELTTAERGEHAFRLLLARFRASNPRFRIADSVIRRYHLSMSTRGFVILAVAVKPDKADFARALVAARARYSRHGA